MTRFRTRTASLVTATVTLLLLLPAAKDKGCGGGDVVIGDDGEGGGDPAVECFVGGCSGQLCSDVPNAASTCEWTPAYACYDAVGICEANADGQCGWRDTPELRDCIANAGREPVEGGCARDNDDACASDADCTVGGCGGEVCYNPQLSEGVSNCDCTTPAVSGCGCVNGTCSWYDEVP